MAKTGGMAGCCMRVGASGIMWDRGNMRATNGGSARPRHDGDVRAKHKGGMAVDNGAGGGWHGCGPWTGPGGCSGHAAVGV